MYVKISPLGGLNEVLLQIPIQAALHYGTEVSRDAPSERVYEEELNASIDFGTIHGVDDSPTGVEKDQSYWIYKYVWWWDEARGIVAVITSGNIYIMSDDGKTIDKVR